MPINATDSMRKEMATHWPSHLARLFPEESRERLKHLKIPLLVSVGRLGKWMGPHGRAAQEVKWSVEELSQVEFTWGLTRGSHCPVPWPVLLVRSQCLAL